MKHIFSSWLSPCSHWSKNILRWLDLSGIVSLGEFRVFIQDKQICKNYGITVEMHKAMYDAQKGRCAICDRHQRSLKKSLSIDHCHQTGKVRGLLCAHCNSLLGFAQDSCANMKRAIKYLKNFSKKLKEEAPDKMLAALREEVDYG